MKTKSIQGLLFFCSIIYLFIQSFFYPASPFCTVPVALWDASISGCLGSSRSLPSNKATASHWPMPLCRLHRVALPHRHLFPPLYRCCPFFHPSITIYLHIGIFWCNVHVDSPLHRLSGLNPLLSNDCLSVPLSDGWREKKSVPPSVNKCLISRLLVPVCLSVCVACRQLSLRSGVAVSQVLVSVLLSVHLPVRASQIRCVNLAPFFLPFFSALVLFFSSSVLSFLTSWGRVLRNSRRAGSTLCLLDAVKLIVASWTVPLFVAVNIECRCWWFNSLM